MARSLKEALRHRAAYIAQRATRSLSLGLFIPYRYLDSVPKTVEPYEAAEASLRAYREDFISFLHAMNAQDERFRALSNGEIRPNWQNSWISPYDCAALYTAIATFRPETMIEIGSGNSTFFACRAVVDHSLPTRINCIDPVPRADIEALPVTLHKRVLSTLDLPMIEALKENDILFVDSSHILQPGFDLDIIFNRALPRLKPGVVVHFHDIFLPHPYPADWADRHYNEQCGLLPWLITGALVPLFASYYTLHEMLDEVRAICPRLPGDMADGSSIWLRKT